MTATTTRLRGALRATLALLSIFGFGAIATLATFTDSGAQPVSFSTGNVDIKFDAANAEDPTALVGLALTNAKPGDSKTQAILVKNAGTLGFGYTISYTAGANYDAGLAGALTVNITQGATTVYNGTLAGLVATPTAVRSLAVAGSESLSFVVTLPSSAGNSVAGKTANGSFVFTATQS